MNDYFQKVISVKNSLNIESVIFTQQTPERQTTLSDIKSGLSNLLGVSNFDLTCKSNLLVEIRFCLGLDYKPIECPSADIQCSSSSPITIVGVIN